MTKLKDLKARFMKEAEFRKEYARADQEYGLSEAEVRARVGAKSSEDGASPEKPRSSSRR